MTFGHGINMDKTFHHNVRCISGVLGFHEVTYPDAKAAKMNHVLLVAQHV
jgi:hypothetical protein